MGQLRKLVNEKREQLIFILVNLYGYSSSDRPYLSNLPLKSLERLVTDTEAERQLPGGRQKNRLPAQTDTDRQRLNISLTGEP